MSVANRIEHNSGMSDRQHSIALVTGASGFIGRLLVTALREHGYRVRTLSRGPSDVDGLEHFALDLAKDDCPTELCLGVSMIFHLAGKAHDLAAHVSDLPQYRHVNVEGTRKLLEAAKQAGVPRFVFFSSVKAVGDGQPQPMDETVSAPADGPYGESKYQAEQLVLHGDYVPYPLVIRPSMVYGNTDKGNLPMMIKAIRRGLFPPLPETGNRRSMVHVDDLVRAAILAAESERTAGKVYIVTDGHAYSTRQIYDGIRAALGKAPISWALPYGLLHGLARLGDGIGWLLKRRFPLDSAALDKLTGSAWYSSARIEAELGFRPTKNLPNSLPDVVRFLDSH